MATFEVITLPSGRRSYPFKQMAVGDWFDEADVMKRFSLDTLAVYYRSRHGRRFSVKKTDHVIRVTRVD